MAKTYAERLRDPRWQMKRLEILKRDNSTCQLCNDKTTELHVHHYCYHSSGNPWESDDDDLVTYCKHCHLMIESCKEFINSVKKIVIDSNNVLLICFPLETTLMFFVYNEKTNKITIAYDLPFILSDTFILPVDAPEKWQCRACGHNNFNSIKCSLCGWKVLNNKILQHG